MPEDNINNIRKIFYHEIGHLCVDIMKIDIVNDAYLNNLNISYISNANQNESLNWCGYVEVLPEYPYSNIPKDLHVFSSFLLSLVSGCIFQTTLNNIYLQKNDDFRDCFGRGNNCLGVKDFHDYNRIVSEFLKINEDSRGNRKLLQFMYGDIIDIFYKELISKKSFINELILITEDYIKAIDEAFRKHDSSNTFSYDIKNEQLSQLINDIKIVLDKHGIFKFINSKIEFIVKTIEEKR